MQNGIPLTDGAAARADRAVRRPRRVGRRRSRRRTTRPPGRGPGTRRSSGASRSPPTSAARAIRWWSAGRRRINDAGGLRDAVHPLHRHRRRRSSKSRGSRSPSAWTGSSRSRSRARASPTPSTTRAPPERHTQQYFESLGNRGDVQGRLVGWLQAERIPWDAHAGDAAHVRARRLRPGRRTRGSSTTCPTTSARPRTSRRRTRRSSRSSRSSSGRRPRSTTCCRCWRHSPSFFGILPPMPDETKFNFYGDVAEHRFRDDPAHLRPLVRDQRRPGRAPRAVPRA